MRKVFITGIPMQNAASLSYKAVGHCRIATGFETFLPIIYVMKQILEKSNDYLLLGVQMQNQDTDTSLSRIREELERYGYSVKHFHVIGLAEKQDEAMTEELLLKILEKIGPGDDLYASLEYGTKPMMLSTVYALQMASSLYREVDVEGVYYGEIRRRNGGIEGAYLNDISSLFYLNRIMQQSDISDQEEPLEAVRNLLKLNRLLS